MSAYESPQPTPTDRRPTMPATDPVQAVADVVQSRAISIEDAWAVMAAARPLIAAEALREAADWVEANPDNLDCEAEASGIAANRLRSRADDLEAGR